jgi:hypothetical protein
MSDYFTLILNSTNIISTNNSSFRYNFLRGGFLVTPDSKICVSTIVIPYAWFNISSSIYKNATFQYRYYYYDSLSGTTKFRLYTVVIPDGYYSVEQINYYLEQYFISQNQYLIDNNGNFVFYIKIIVNPTYYTTQIIYYLLPYALPSGWTEPAGGYNINTNADGYCVIGSQYTPQIVIPSYTGIYGFGSIIGYLAGVYPSSPTQTNTNSLGNTTPNLTNVNALVVTCNLVNNDIVVPSNILDHFSIQNTSFGYNIVYQPAFETWVSISEGNYSSMDINFYDQLFRPLVTNDPNISIQLSVKLGPTPLPKFIKEFKPINKLFKDNDEKVEEIE